jgi:hypothetical protein
VYEKRFYDKMIMDKEGMLKVSRYIHLNPVEAKMVKQPEFYPWSSYRFYVDEKATAPPFMNRNSLLDYYEGALEQKRKNYCNSIVVGHRDTSEFVE